MALKAEHLWELFENTQRSYKKERWNGEYFTQSIIIDPIDDIQFGAGCHSDQLLGQCLACSAGMDNLLPSKMINRAMLSVYRYNFSKNLNNHINTGRGNVVNDEGGLLTCTWPHGRRPGVSGSGSRRSLDGR